jgi:hypothetical protein
VFCVLSWLGLRAVSGSRRPRVRRRRRLDDLETGILPAMPQLASLLPAAASASRPAAACHGRAQGLLLLPKLPQNL